MMEEQEDGCNLFEGFSQVELKVRNATMIMTVF